MMTEKIENVKKELKSVENLKKQTRKRGDIKKMYKLILQGDKTKEAIDKINSDNLTSAKEFFMARKQMDKKTFNKLYEVIKDGK
tara:strand:+ start:1246 stop:1497 length:252 start_codon:yes stop_codon:yes gene_type:complete